MAISDVRPSTVESRAPGLGQQYRAMRAQTEWLCTPLETEDFVVSSMPDVSPTKWHLAHTSWFFETFVLAPFVPSYVEHNPRYAFLFNSYYVQAGERHCRAQRGLVTRPTVCEVFEYRARIDHEMQALIDRIGDDREHPAHAIVELGIHHEQQHQELLLTDIKHVFWINPLRPAYAPAPLRSSVAAPSLVWHPVREGVYRIGHGGDGFAFDNEGPTHRVFVDDFVIGSRLITNGEFLAFMDDSGYRRPELWLSTGWNLVQQEKRNAPFYWEKVLGAWTEFTLAGTHPVDLAAPVTHVSYFEADAYARWSGHRLPTEAEWEIAAGPAPVEGHFVDAGRFHPAPAKGAETAYPEQLFGDAWQWTQSAYVAYPGYAPAPGAIGEYNGKWMCDQWVLRGASCATPKSHARTTYRNFFPSDTRWQFTGIRLASGACPP